MRARGGRAPCPAAPPPIRNLAPPPGPPPSDPEAAPAGWRPPLPTVDFDSDDADSDEDDGIAVAQEEERGEVGTLDLNKKAPRESALMRGFKLNLGKVPPNEVDDEKPSAVRRPAPRRLARRAAPRPSDPLPSPVPPQVPMTPTGSVLEYLKKQKSASDGVGDGRARGSFFDLSDDGGSDDEQTGEPPPLPTPEAHAEMQKRLSESRRVSMAMGLPVAARRSSAMKAGKAALKKLPPALQRASSSLDQILDDQDDDDSGDDSPSPMDAAAAARKQSHMALADAGLLRPSSSSISSAVEMSGGRDRGISTASSKKGSARQWSEEAAARQRREGKNPSVSGGAPALRRLSTDAFLSTGAALHEGEGEDTFDADGGAARNTSSEDDDDETPRDYVRGSERKPSARPSSAPSRSSEERPGTPSGETFEEDERMRMEAQAGGMQDLQRRPSQFQPKWTNQIASGTRAAPPAPVAVPDPRQPDRVRDGGTAGLGGGAGPPSRAKFLPQGVGGEVVEDTSQGRLRQTSKGGLISRLRGTSRGGQSAGGGHVGAAGVVDADGFDEGGRRAEDRRRGDGGGELGGGGGAAAQSGGGRVRRRAGGAAADPAEGRAGGVGVQARRLQVEGVQEAVRCVRAAHQLVVLLREQGARERAHEGEGAGEGGAGGGGEEVGGARQHGAAHLAHRDDAHGGRRRRQARVPLQHGGGARVRVLRRERRGAQAVARRAPRPRRPPGAGYLHKRKQGAKSKTFDRRYAVFDPQTNVFSYYSNERDARMDKDIKGCVTVAITVLYPDKFAFYTQEGRFFECYTETPEELAMWQDGLPAPAAAIVRGWVYKHKRGAKSSKFQRRYAVYELESGVFTYYTDDSMSVPKGRTHVMYAIRRLAPKNRCEGQKLVEFEGEMVEARMYEFTIRTEDSKFFDVAVESLEKRDEWVDGMPKPPSFAISGWLNQRGGFLGSKRKLFSTVRTEGSGAAGGLPAYIFSAYLTEESALLEDVPAELKKKCKYAVPRPPKEKGMFEFAFTAEEDREHVQEGSDAAKLIEQGEVLSATKFHEFCVDSEALQQKWLGTLPPPKDFTVKGYLYKKRHGAKRGLFAEEFDHRFAVYDVLTGIFSYYETEDEALMDMKPRGRVRVVAAVLRPTVDHQFMFSFYTEDGKDYQLYVESPEELHMWMNALPIYSGQYGANTDKIMTALREEVSSLKRQVNYANESDILKGGMLNAEQFKEGGGPQLTRAQRLSNVDAMRLKRELEHLRTENRRLRMENTGEIDDAENAIIMEAFMEGLRDMITMRKQGKFVQSIFDGYNEMLVQLSDEHVTEMYKNFMLIYVEEADDEVFKRMRIKESDVDAPVLGFCEMMTIKLGEMMDQPRHVRIQALQSEKKKKAEQELSRQKQLEKEKENYAKLQAKKAEIRAIYDATFRTIEGLHTGEGDEKEIRRYQRKPELQLLNKSTLELKQMSAYQWQNMSSSGLRREEVATLIHVLSQEGMPKQSAAFLALLNTKFLAMPADGSAPKPPARPKPLPGGAPPPKRKTMVARKSRGDPSGAPPPIIQLHPSAPKPPPLPGSSAAPPPPPPPPPPMVFASSKERDSTASLASDGGDPGSAMRAAIEARRAKAEARAAAIEAGEVAVVDPREQRMSDLKYATRGRPIE